MDWPGLIRAGLGVLRLDPQTFWDLTPAELMLLLGKTGQAAPMSRSRLDRLLEAFPDTHRGDDG